MCVYIKGLTVSFRYWLRYRCFLSACNGRSRIDREGNKQLYPTYNHLRSQVYRYNLLQGHSGVWKLFEMHDWPNSGKFRVIKCRNKITVDKAQLIVYIISAHLNSIQHVITMVKMCYLGWHLNVCLTKVKLTFWTVCTVQCII